MHGLFLLLILFEQSLGQMGNHKNALKLVRVKKPEPFRRSKP